LAQGARESWRGDATICLRRAMMISRWCLGWLSLAASTWTFEFRSEHACGVCLELLHGASGCERFGACHAVNASSTADGCASLCPAKELPPGASVATAASLDVRVTKGFGTKSYDQVRISVISRNAAPPVAGFFDYSGQFQYRWKELFTHTSMKSATPGKMASFDIGLTSPLALQLPKQGEGVAGLLIGDPCVGGGLLGLACTYGEKLQTRKRIPELISTFVPDNDMHFWGIVGDNFYDRTGRVSQEVFADISLEAKAKLFVTVPGNHDYWILGNPVAASVLDQCGNGFLQFYAQDTKAAETVGLGSSRAPFNFSVPPDGGLPLVGCKLPAAANFFWYNQVGNVGLIGQSGAYSLADAKPHMAEACAWLAKQPGLQVALLVGHWDLPNLGSSTDMAMPQWYTEMAALPGCAEFDRRQMLKFVMGHTHCNSPHPRGKVGAGFRVAGYGMEGCGNFGVPIFDTTGGRVRFWYFDTSSDDAYDAVIDCAKRKGWRQCTGLATLWLDERIAPPEELELLPVSI